MESLLMYFCTVPSKWELLDEYLLSKCLLSDKLILGDSTEAFVVEGYEVTSLEERNFKASDIIGDW